MKLSITEWIDSIKYHNENYGMSTLEILEDIKPQIDELEEINYTDEEIQEIEECSFGEGKDEARYEMITELENTLKDISNNLDDIIKDQKGSSIDVIIDDILESIKQSL